jgi:tRNA (guanine-N7-)-methyltransferase
LGPDGSLRRVFVHFPDPWWKKRHQKRLVVSGRFLDEVARLVEERAQDYEKLVGEDARFAPCGEVPGSARIAENPYIARSPRERRAIADGLPVHRLRWSRQAAASRQ